MYKKLLVSFSAFLILFFSPGFVKAQTNDSTQNVVTNQSEQAQDSTTEERKARVEKYKLEVAERLTNAQEKKISDICKTSQLKLEKVQTSVEETVAKRQEKLQSIVEKLEDLSVKLREASVNTTELDAVIISLKSKTTEMMTGFEEYQQTLEDSSIVDCEVDPVGFKASIEAARLKRTEIKTMSIDIKKYVTESVNTLLGQIKASLSQTSVGSEE